MESKYFFQFSGTDSPAQVKEIGRWIEGKIPDPRLRICVGVPADTDSISDDTAVQKIKDIFQSTKDFPVMVPVLHFSFRNSHEPVADIERVHAAMPFVEYIQLNDVEGDLLPLLRKAVQYFL